MQLQEMATKLSDERAALAKLFADHKSDDGTYDLSSDQLAEAGNRNVAIDKLAKDYEAAVGLVTMADGNEAALKALSTGRPALPLDAPGKGTAAPAKARTWDEVLAPHAALMKSMSGGGHGIVSLDLTGAETKTLLTESSISPTADRQALVPIADYLADVTTLFQPGTTSSSIIEFYEETTETPAAAETAEGSAAGEAAFDFTLRQMAVQEISHFLPATRRVLDDNPGLQSFLQGRLQHGLDKRRSQQVLQGDGNAPNIRGILNNAQLQTQAKGADPVFDAIHKGTTKVAVTGDAAATGVVMHPNDWQDLRLTRTIDGLYILGNPADAAPTRIWGLDVRVTTSVPENTALVGGFRPFAQIFNREGVTLEFSSDYSDYFIKRKVALLIYQRLALAIYRGSAFCQVTGI